MSIHLEISFDLVKKKKKIKYKCFQDTERR